MGSQGDEHQALNRKGSITGIVCNLGLFAVKASAGAVSGSMAVVVDAVNNLSDAVSSLLGLAVSVLADKPADTAHPFGHGRIEYVATLVIAMLVGNVGLELARTSFERIQKPEPLRSSPLLFTLLILAIGVKVFLYFYEKKLGEKASSDMLLTMSRDALFDCLITGLTILSLVVTRYTGKVIDGYVGLALSMIILYQAYGMIRESMVPLLGRENDAGAKEGIVRIIEENREVLGLHDLVLHDYGHGRMLGSAHIELPQDMSLVSAHRVADELENRILEESGIRMVLHVDPVNVHDPLLSKIRDQGNRIASILDPEMTIHDVHFLEKGDKSLVSMELQIPLSRPEKESRQIGEQFEQLMRETNPDCDFVITCDRGLI